MSAARRFRTIFLLVSAILLSFVTLLTVFSDSYRSAAGPFDAGQHDLPHGADAGKALEKVEDASRIATSTSPGQYQPLTSTLLGEAGEEPVLANATFVILARNSDREGVVGSIREIEQRFNARRQYPYVLLNDQEFTIDFKAAIANATTSSVEFGLIPRADWVQPDWIDEERAAAAREKMAEDGVKYGGLLDRLTLLDDSYRNMCRFNSGFFYRHPLMQKYKYYWRIEPNVHFLCDVRSDPFLYMQEHDKTYGFTLAVHEIRATIPSLWETVTTFTDQHPEYVVPDNALGFISNDGDNAYNGCHFWSNFEIADMDFFRGEAYSQYFDFLDRSGGYYYERWGDAPVHSIAVSLFLNASKLHFFDPIGYQHDDWRHCPLARETYDAGNCSCDYLKEFDYSGGSCKALWDHFIRTKSLDRQEIAVPEW
ncbi:glycosyltransferase family 15 protein [Schizophyllum fasciatum]